MNGIPVAAVEVELCPRLVEGGEGGGVGGEANIPSIATEAVSSAVEDALGLLGGEVLDALLGEDAHVDLEADEGEHSESEAGEDDDVAQVLHRLDHRAHDRLEACCWKDESQSIIGKASVSGDRS